MVGIGMLLILLGLVGAFLWWRKRVFETRWYLRVAGYAWPAGFIAILAGWVMTGAGRQPYVAYGILRTADAISPVAALDGVDVAHRVHGGLSRRVLDRRVLHPQAHPERAQGAAIEPPTPDHALPNRPLATAQHSTHVKRGSGGSAI